MRISTIDPRGMGVVEWIERMNPELDSFGDIPIIYEESEWKDWAYVVCSNPQIARCQPPDARFFDDWQDWACRFIQTIYALSN